MTEQQRAAKQARYDELRAIADAHQSTDLQSNERIQLYHELHPESKDWDSDLTPEDIWHAKANGSFVAG
jgi:hypothetical protein